MLNSKTTGGAKGSVNINIWEKKNPALFSNIKSKMSGLKHFNVLTTVTAD